MNSRPAEAPSERDCSIPLGRANLLVIVLSVPVAALLYLLFLLLQPTLPVEARLSAGDLLVLLTFFVAGITGHELLHALGWILAGRLPPRRVAFGFKLKALAPYAHLNGPVPARAYRIGIVLPLLVLGVPPYVLGIGLADMRLMLFGLFFTLAAGGDLLVLWLLRGVPPEAMVEDHPSRAGCIAYLMDESGRP